MPTSENRTYWSTQGGAIAFQPGWFQGHATAFVYVNLGFGNEGPDFNPDLRGPPNMSNPMVPPFQILGPTKQPYPGTVCLPQVPLPANTTVKAGDLATIQLVELAVHGAALYSVCPLHVPPHLTSPNPPPQQRKERNTDRCVCGSQCVDIIFAEPGDPRIPLVNETNCFNSTEIGVADIYTLTLRASGQGNLATSGAVRGAGALAYWGYLSLVLLGAVWAVL
jgi:hypothetical protein